MNNLNFKEAVAELGQAADYLRSTGASKVGCTGKGFFMSSVSSMSSHLFIFVSLVET
jgi:hypothetical protein